MTPSKSVRGYRRPAFSLVELLVVTAIVGALVALLMPAVQAAREAAWRSQCSSNMRQVALGMHNYTTRIGAFPPGYISRIRPNRDDAGPGWSCFAMILNDLEQSGLQRLIDFNQPIEHPKNEAARLTSIGVLLCPSDANFAPVIDVPHYESGITICRLAAANMVVSIGSIEPTCKVCRDVPDGMFGRNSCVRFRDIVDGTSQTIGGGERSFKWSTPAPLGVVAGAKLQDRLKPDKYVGGPGYVLATVSDGLREDPELSENEKHTYAERFGSLHPAGSNFWFCDGGVRFLPELIDQAVFEELATRHGTARGKGVIHSNPFGG